MRNRFRSETGGRKGQLAGYYNKSNPWQRARKVLDREVLRRKTDKII